jgi:hypothetical protein
MAQRVPASGVGFVPWERIAARFGRDFRPGMHVTAIGPTGAGKSHALLALADLADHWTFALAAKRRDPLLESLIGSGYVPIESVREISWADDGPLHRRYLYWPKPAAKDEEREQLVWQAGKMREALKFVSQTESWVVLVDELQLFVRDLGLGRELSSYYRQWRTQGCSMLGGGQRPTHVPLEALNQCSYLLIWQTSDERDLERLSEISAGFSRQMIARAVVDLDWERHELLFVDVRRRQLARTIAPARASVTQLRREGAPRERRRGTTP